VNECLPIEQKYLSDPEKAETVMSASGESFTFRAAVLTAETGEEAAISSLKWMMG
jgi:hypothetical protein